MVKPLVLALLLAMLGVTHPSRAVAGRGTPTTGKKAKWQPWQRSAGGLREDNRINFLKSDLKDGELTQGKLLRLTITLGLTSILIQSHGIGFLAGLVGGALTGHFAHNVWDAYKADQKVGEQGEKMRRDYARKTELEEALRKRDVEHGWVNPGDIHYFTRDRKPARPAVH